MNLPIPEIQIAGLSALITYSFNEMVFYYSNIATVYLLFNLGLMCFLIKIAWELYHE